MIYDYIDREAGLFCKDLKGREHDGWVPLWQTFRRYDKGSVTYFSVVITAEDKKGG